MRRVLLAIGCLTLAAAWLGPLPALAEHRFSAHMTMHVVVVAVAAPLIAFGAAGGPLDPTRRWPHLLAAIPASAVELLVIWAWHAPALHRMARTTSLGVVAEQGTFFAVALFVWMAAVGQDRRGTAGRSAAGVVALLLTSMHMTLLGALLALAPRDLYGHHLDPGSAARRLDDQELGGAIMLLVGGASYLLGGLVLMRRLLRTVLVLREEAG
jgi:putative membrane protein